MDSRILLILDIDETLIHASHFELDQQPDFTFNNYYIYKRPYLDEFLAECSKYYDLAVWSSAGDIYVEEAVKSIIPSSIPLRFAWGSSRTTYNINMEAWKMEVCHLKDLKKVVRNGYKIGKILIVDDDPQKLRRNYGNAIYVKHFEGDPKDNELLFLMKYLKTLYNVEDVHRIEKRYWRSYVKNRIQAEVQEVKDKTRLR